MNDLYKFDLVAFRKLTAKLKQEQFATKIGIGRGTLAKIEAGHAPVTDGILEKIEKAYAIDLTKYKNAYKESAAYLAKNIEPLLSMDTPEVYNKTEQRRLLDMLQQKDKDLEECRKENEKLLKQMLKMKEGKEEEIKKVKVKPGR